MVAKGATTPKITIPPLKPATPEEIERRRILYERARRFRKEVGPIGISTAELIRQVRGETAECDG